MQSRMWAFVVAAAAVLAAVAVPARAEFASGATVTEFLPGDFTDNVTQDTTKISAADGVFVFDKTEVSPLGGSFVDVDAAFGTNPQVVLQAKVYTGTVSGAYLTAVSFINTANGSSASAFGFSSSEGALGSNALTTFNFALGGTGAYALSTIGTFTTYDHMALTFAFDNPGDQLALDAVANPEPGAWALFALGTAGLAAFVRNRRARVARPA